jgi:phosphate-selective porin
MNTHRNTVRAAALGGALCAVALNAAEPTSVEERLKKLETQYEAIAKENADLKKQLGWDGKGDLVVVKPGGKEKSLKVGGYLQAHAEFGEPPDARYNNINDRFFVRRARVNVSGAFAEHFDFKAEVDLGNNSLAATTAGNWKPSASDIFVNWNRYDFANVKIGQFKTPFGYEQIMPDTQTWFAERSLANDRLTESRQIGAAVSGSFFDKRLAYSVGAFNGNGVNQGGNDDDNFIWVGRINGTAWSGKLFDQDTKLNLGVNGYVDDSTAVSKGGFGFTGNSFSGDRHGLGADLQLTFGRFALAAEYLHGHFEPANAVPFAEVDAQGYYVMVGYDILPKKLQAKLRFDSFDPNTDVSGNDTEAWTLGLTDLLKGNDIRFDVNYVIGNPGGGMSDGNLLITRVQLAF